MRRRYVLNAFSLNMLAEEDLPASIEVKAADLARAREYAKIAESAVGHADTARVFSGLLGVEVPARRATVTLRRGDSALVGQYRGPRLPEGATELPEGATIKWLFVSVLED